MGRRRQFNPRYNSCVLPRNLCPMRLSRRSEPFDSDEFSYELKRFVSQRAGTPNRKDRPRNKNVLEQLRLSLRSAQRHWHQEESPTCNLAALRYRTKERLNRA
jgi:hypothetical protein